MKAQHETGVWTVNYPDTLKDAVHETAKRWQEFCALPDDIQDILATDNMFNGSGFERKLGDGDTKNRFSHDKKLNFDATSTGLPVLSSQLNKLNDNEQFQTVSRFLAAFSKLAQHAPLVIEEFGRTIEDEYEVSDFYTLAQESASNAFFRCLYYPPTDAVGEVIGEAHIDNSGFTLHLFESTEGCEALSMDRESWYPMPILKDSALAFPSMQTQLYSEGKIDGLCHRILSNETTRKVGRYAIVCFVPLYGVAPYNRTQHGRLQEKEPGFNYGMNASEFAQYFSDTK